MSYKLQGTTGTSDFRLDGAGFMKYVKSGGGKMWTLPFLKKKVNALTLQQQENIESYIDSLLRQNSNGAKSPRKPLDFSKYDTAPRVWSEDAQNFVNGMRADDRF